MKLKRLMRMVGGLFGLLTLVVVVDQLRHYLATRGGIEMRSSYFLNENELKALEEKWLRERDPEAADRLGRFYGSYADTPEEGAAIRLKWARRAAAGGSADFQYNLSVRLTTQDDLNDVAEGIAILESLIERNAQPHGKEEKRLQLRLHDQLANLERLLSSRLPREAHIP